MLDEINQILTEMLRILFLYGLPMVAVMAVVGTVISAIQAATLISEPALGYIARLLAFIFVCYLFGTSLVTELINLGQMAFK